MPHGVTGGQVVQHMRGSYPDIPMLITAARADAITAEFRERLGVEMLAKPYDAASLVATVGRLPGLTPSRYLPGTQRGPGEPRASPPPPAPAVASALRRLA